jgi:hypothetical protein
VVQYQFFPTTHDPVGYSGSSTVPLISLAPAGLSLWGLGRQTYPRQRGLTAALSPMEGVRAKPVKAFSQNLEAVLTALRQHGVEVDEESIRLVKRGRR